MTRRPWTLVRSLVVTPLLVAALHGGAVAHADSVSLAVTDASGQSDPAASLVRTFTFSGSSSTPERLLVKTRSAGGAPCAASADADLGAYAFGYGLFGSSTVDGVFSLDRSDIWNDTGAVIYCMWLAPDRDTPSAPTAQIVTYREATKSISATVSPASPAPGRPFTVTVAGASEAETHAFAKLRHAGGAACAADEPDDSGVEVLADQAANGSFSFPFERTLPQAGSYVLCLWLTSDYGGRTIGAPGQVTFDVGAPAAAVTTRTPYAVIALASPITCRQGVRTRVFRARSLESICMRYVFGELPTAGQRLSLAFLGPNDRVYRRIDSRWSAGHAPTLRAGSLLGRAVIHHPGVWHAILSIDGRRVATTAFRVIA